MNEQDAIKILVQVANLAQERGVLTFQDASFAINAIQVLQPEKPQLSLQPLQKAPEPVMEKVE